MGSVPAAIGWYMLSIAARSRRCHDLRIEVAEGSRALTVGEETSEPLDGLLVMLLPSVLAVCG
jgi:hypothetical protein